MGRTRDIRPTPERWQAALRRGVAEGIRVRQSASSGAWSATSGTDPKVSYDLDVQGPIVTGCSCQAAEFGDPVCKHRAVWYYTAGMLDLYEEEKPDAEPAGDRHPYGQFAGAVGQ